MGLYLPTPVKDEKLLVKETLEYCNKVRRANGAVEIEKLIEGYHEDPRHCVVAQSVNCGLAVSGINTNGSTHHPECGMWALFAHTDDAVQALKNVAAELHQPIEYRVPNGWMDEDDRHVAAPSMPSLIVPEAVKKVAMMFDHGLLSPELLTPLKEEKRIK